MATEDKSIKRRRGTEAALKATGQLIDGQAGFCSDKKRSFSSVRPHGQIQVVLMNMTSTELKPILLKIQMPSLKTPAT